MKQKASENPELRVLVLAPTARDARMTRSVLEDAEMACVSCSDMAEFCRELKAGAAVVVLPEEAILPDPRGCLMQWLAGQPRWSDLPVLVLARPGADSAALAQAMDLLGNVTVLERPTRVTAFVSAIRTALRARERQYQIREHLTEHRRAEEALREADRRKDDFLAVLAHELRNPLAPIRSSLQILRLTRPHDAATAHVAEVMDRQVNVMVRLVDDLLEVSRISRGKVVLHKERVEVAAIVYSGVETSRPLLEAGNHDLTLSIPLEPIVLEGDPVRLTQVVANLLNNAAKYCDPNGRIALEVRPEGTGVAISVRDNGSGIPVEMLPLVFEPFMQIDPRDGRAQGGLGIGLTLTKSLVELHGGTVEAHSEGPGRGSEFIVRLPVGAPLDAVADVHALPSAASGALAAHRILVVDDNRDAADSLKTLLHLQGADVRAVYSGEEALEAVETHRPSIVLMDIGMPGIDGLEAARRIRQRPEGQGVTLIALTGWGQEEDRTRSQEAGFDHHLIKPVDFGSLQSLLASVTGKPKR